MVAGDGGVEYEVGILRNLWLPTHVLYDYYLPYPASMNMGILLELSMKMMMMDIAW